MTLPLSADADSFPPAIRRQGRFFIYRGGGSDGSSLISKRKVIESPDSLHLPENENWAGGVLHFVDDGYREFVARYRARCENLRAYLLDARERGLPMTFTISVPSRKGRFSDVAAAAHKRLRDAVVDHLLPPGSLEPKFALFEEENDDQYASDMELIDVVRTSLGMWGSAEA